MSNTPSRTDRVILWAHLPNTTEWGPGIYAVGFASDGVEIHVHRDGDRIIAYEHSDGSSVRLGSFASMADVRAWCGRYAGPKDQRRLEEALGRTGYRCDTCGARVKTADEEPKL